MFVSFPRISKSISTPVGIEPMTFGILTQCSSLMLHLFIKSASVFDLEDAASVLRGILASREGSFRAEKNPGNDSDFSLVFIRR